MQSAEVKAPQQIISTQGFNCAYQFTKKPKQIEQAERALEMGSTMFKTGISNINDPILQPILTMPFDTLFFWWRSNGKIWQNGLSEKDKNAEYQATKAFAKKLLLENANTARTFFLGHWEGDWYLLPDSDPDKIPSQTRIQGMIDWLNIRQKAVDDAHDEVIKEKPNCLSKVYHYTEVNRVRDAMLDDNKKRVVNAVLPNVDVDYVSYSSYDVQRLSQTEVNKTIHYVENQIGKNLNNKKPFQGIRVFIGECAIPAKEFNYDPIKHEKANREVFIKFLNSGVPYILYWQMYNNELFTNQQLSAWLEEQGINPKNIEKFCLNTEGEFAEQQMGFWLINDKNQIQPLYTTLQKLNSAEKKFKNTDEMIEWLKNYSPVQQHIYSKSHDVTFTQPQLEKVAQMLLYQTKKGELAVKFPDEETANNFIKQLGGKMMYKDELYPQQFEHNKTTLFFPGYEAKNGEFAGVFPSEAMRKKFFDIIKNYTKAFDSTNKADENVIYFEDKIFFQKGGNVGIPLPSEIQQNSVSLNKNKFQ